MCHREGLKKIMEYKSVFFLKKDFSAVNEFSNLKNPKAGAGAHLYERQRCGN